MMTGRYVEERATNACNASSDGLNRVIDPGRADEIDARISIEGCARQREKPARYVAHPWSRSWAARRHDPRRSSSRVTSTTLSPAATPSRHQRPIQPPAPFKPWPCLLASASGSSVCRCIPHLNSEPIALRPRARRGRCRRRVFLKRGCTVGDRDHQAFLHRITR